MKSDQSIKNSATRAHSSQLRDYRERIVDLGILDPDSDGLTILQHVVDSTGPLIDADPSEWLREQEVVEVERLFSEGRISVPSAAERLGLTIQEFVAEFVFDETSVPVVSSQEREALIVNATEALSELKAGRSIRGFIQQCVLNEEHLAIAGASMGEDAMNGLQQAVNNLPADSLGIALRQALSVGYSLPEFVALFIFNPEWQAASGLDDEAVTELVRRAVTALESAHEYLLSASWFSALHVRDKQIPDRIVDRLSYAIARRRIRNAKELLVQCDNRRLLVSPSQKHAAVLLNLYAQWIDFDFSYLLRVEEALVGFSHQPPERRTPLDSAHLDIAEGLVNLHNENYNRSIVHFKYAMKRAHSVRDKDLMVICLYFLSRSYWKKGLYVKALCYAGRAKDRNKKLARPEREAAIEMLEGWLLLLLGDRDQAKLRLANAHKVLHETDDYTNHGNARSFNGRLCKDEGQYAKALEFFEDAVWFYQSADSKHRNIARTYINMADVCFLDARQLSANPDCRARVLQRRLEAFEYLEAAEEIYLLDPERNHRGLGKLHNMRAFLYAASGEFDRARAETERAYFFGSQKKDHLVMGKARKNQWTILTDERRSWARSNDDEVPDEAILAFASAEEALRHAMKTNNQRLQARCHLYLGHSLLRLDRDHVRAQECHSAARACIYGIPSQQSPPQSPSQQSESQESYWKEKLDTLQDAINDCTKTTDDREAELAC